MPAIRREIRFMLNGKPVTLDAFRCDATLLDWLRIERGLTGSKEGCAEGDCGACTVLVGRLRDGSLVYETVNACIRFLGSLDGCHVVTVEHLKRRGGRLHPVQQALVDHHGSQCGFCTPGIVMSLYALWMTNPKPSDAAIERALQGNLCRCTGYEPIVKAARALPGRAAVAKDPLVAERARVVEGLESMRDDARIDIEHDGTRTIIPADADDLVAVMAEHPNARIVAGSTDVGLWVTKQMRAISPAVFIGEIETLRAIRATKAGLTIGACATYSEAFAALSDVHRAFHELFDRIGGEQVRNMGTIGGNIANGSPIGDTPPPLIALGAVLALRSAQGRRTIPLEDFFIDYGKQDRKPGEIVESILVPAPGKHDLFAVYKLSKRRDEDITAVLGALRVRVEKRIVTDAALAFGGMAATPKRADKAEAALLGKEFGEPAIRDAMAALTQDFTPLNDWRASADYRMRAARNLLLRFWLEHGGTTQPVRLKRHEAA
jgi:xanthine dehydrogenase small subunit